MRASFAYRTVRRFAREEQGVVTVQTLFFTLAICGVGAIALDVTHFYAARSQLQVAADLAAHAALYTARYGNYDSTTGAHLPISDVSDTAAKDAAIARVQNDMPTSPYGPVITRADIVLGRYNYGTDRIDSVDDPSTTGIIEYDPAEVDTAAVFTHRQGGSAVGSFHLGRATIFAGPALVVYATSLGRAGSGSLNRSVEWIVRATSA